MAAQLSDEIVRFGRIVRRVGAFGVCVCVSLILPWFELSRVVVD